MRLHVTAGGTPHRVPHSMGYWHINDMDELYLPLPSAPGDPLGHNVIVMQNPTGKEGESWAWYCETCLTLLFERHHVTGTLGMDFKKSELAVREYNSDPKHRTCPDCGTVNPIGYCWNPAKDTAEEHARLGNSGSRLRRPHRIRRENAVDGPSLPGMRLRSPPSRRNRGRPTGRCSANGHAEDGGEGRRSRTCRSV